MNNDQMERRAESRSRIEQYYSVEFRISDQDYLYQFKIRNISTKGVCVLIREDSDILKHLEVGDILDMKYYPGDLLSPPVNLKTQIKHITKDDEGRFKNHYLVGLSILEH